MSENEKYMLKCEFSALKIGELFALSNTTDTATLTIICEMNELSQAFSYRVLSEFQSTLHSTCSSCSGDTRSQVVRNKIVALECAVQNWMAVYIDTSCVRIFGRGAFVCYFLDSNRNELKFGGFAPAREYDFIVPLIDNQSFTLLVSSADSETKILPLIEASRKLQYATDILTYAFARWVVEEKTFCVIAMTASRMPAFPGAFVRTKDSPRKSHLNVLDSNQNFIRSKRHEICQSADEIDAAM
jgi:hypothetical protein